MAQGTPVVLCIAHNAKDFQPTAHACPTPPHPTHNPNARFETNRPIERCLLQDGPPQQVHTRALAQAAAAPSAPTAAAPSAAPAPAPAQPDVTVVTTPEELQAAAQASAAHIEIRAHLDCRNLTRLGNPDLPPTSSTGTRPRLALLYARASMQSIRVRLVPHLSCMHTLWCGRAYVSVSAPSTVSSHGVT